MDTSVFGALAGAGLVTLLIGVVVGVAVGALILSLAFRIIVGSMPPYLRAAGAVVVTAIVGVVAAVIVGLVTRGFAGSALLMVVQFLVGAAVVNYLLPSPTGGQIGFGKACLVQLVYLVIMILLGVLFGVLFAAVLGGLLAHA